MLVRQVVIPVNADQLWTALTDTDALAGWFGARVDWDLRPGGEARFLDDDGTARAGVVIDVRPGRHLRFRWWPEGETDGAASEVNYDLEPEDEGTRLTVTEEPAPLPEAPVKTSPTQASASVAGTAGAQDGATWTRWDGLIFGLWAGDSGLWTERDSELFRCWSQDGDTGTLGDAGVWTEWDSWLILCWARQDNRAAAVVGPRA